LRRARTGVDDGDVAPGSVVGIHESAAPTTDKEGEDGGAAAEGERHSMERVVRALRTACGFVVGTVWLFARWWAQHLRGRRRVPAAALVLVALLVGLPTLTPTATVLSPPQPPVDYHFGVAESTMNPLAAAPLNIGWTRVPLFWNQLEPKPGQFNPYYTDHDQLYLTAAAEGQALVGDVEGVPRWAAVDPKDGPDAVPQGLDLPWNNPGNTWGQFMYWLAYHYRGLINTWVIGNEISILTGPHHTWDGTLAQYAQLLMVAQQAVQAANPVAHVLPPSTPYWYAHGHITQAFLADLAQLPGAAQHHDYIDGFGLNLYNTIVFNRMIYVRYQGLLRQAGLGQLPIWLTETNGTPDSPRYHRGETPLQQAEFLVETLASSPAYVTREEVYKLRDTKPHSRFQYGMIRYNGRPREEVTAFEAFTRLMRGATWLGQRIWTMHDGNLVLAPVAQVTWGEPRHLIQIVWDQGYKPTTAYVKAYAPSATLVNMWGQSQTIGASGGYFVVPLQPATYHTPHVAIAYVGGPPYYVIQRVRLGEAGTPRTWNFGSPSGFPASPTGRWSRHHAFPTTRGVTVYWNTAGDQVVIDDRGTLHWITDYGTAPSQLNGPVDAVVGPLVYNRHGRLLRVIGGYPWLLGVAGVAVNLRGDLFVTDPGAQAVVEYTTRGHFIRGWGTWGTGRAQFDGPTGIMVAPNGVVVVADTLNQRVEMFTRRGKYLRAMPVNGDPVAVTWGQNGYLNVQLTTGQWTTVLFKPTPKTIAPKSS
jgi:hypothetical protein